MIEPKPFPQLSAALIAFGVGVTLIVWAGAELAAIIASGHLLHVSTAVALRCAVEAFGHASTPARSWPRPVGRDLPGPVLYWAATGFVLIAASIVAGATARLVGRVSTRSRTRLGVEASARLARPGELAPLLIRRPVAGRFILGRVGGRLVATEDSSNTQRMRRWQRATLPGRRSSVALIGPTRCGKTAAAITGILEWRGPAILSSVKTDLMSATIAWRRSLGEVRVFDPTGSTDEPTYGWTPLREATTVTGAQKAARAILDAGPRASTEDLDFFLRLAEQLVWPLLLLAATSHLTMRDVVSWILTQQSPLDDQTALGQILRTPTSGIPTRRRQATVDATRALAGIWALDQRTRSSAYATAQTILVPWTDPGVAEASDYDEINLDWLLGGENTLYLCAPLHEQQRLAPVFGGMLGDLIAQAYERVSRTDRELPATLLVLDEAANTPTRWLPQVASTCPGLGLLLVTIWQSKAQLDATYGPLADSVLTNHATKLIFSGVSDLPTLDYAARLVGDEEIVRRATSIDQEQGRRTLNLSQQPVQLLPGHVLRQSKPGNALLVHGSLPPAHLRTCPYYQERRLRTRVVASSRNARASGRKG
ncbi:MAG TPA: type IV secretory system conjugative DNA transfer family protein [Acidimicrobiales bacterium]|nr:type IV secretory system conjugative DNA transfer family protein [Acidimicrobiales bacterium]